MRRLTVIVVFLVGAVGLLQWLSIGFLTTWEPQLRQYLETIAGRATHTRVTIDAIVPAFFHHVRLTHVTVFDEGAPAEPIFQAGEIELTVSLIDLPRAILHRRAYEAIGVIEVKNPRLTLSPALLQKRLSHRAASASLPPWFTLIWEGGTVQWLDLQAPHGRWTLYQAHGIFRIRGPRMTLALQGEVAQARSLRLHYGSFGRRWSAQLLVSEAQCRSALALAETLLKRRLLPQGWSAQGTFDLDVRADGRRRPAPGDDWQELISLARATFHPAKEDDKANADAVGISGILTYKNRKVTSPALTIDCPWFQGSARLEMSVKDLLRHPDIFLDAAVGQGRLGPAPFQDALIQARYVNERWDFLQNTLHIFGGQVSAKGHVSRLDSDLAVTAENISLTAMGPETGAVQGQLNASGRFIGPLNDWQLSGAWWLTGAAWGKTALGDVRGDLEIVPGHFQAQAKSDNQRFRFSTEGSSSEDQFYVDRFEIHLPDGAALTAGAHLDRATRRLRAAADITGAAFPQDLPYPAFEHTSLKGILAGHARLSGTWQNPLLKGTVQSDAVSVGPYPVGKAAATFAWSKSHLDIPAFHVGPGLSGRYSRESGSAPSSALDLTFQHAPAALLGALQAHPLVTEGVVDGSMALRRKEAWSGQGDLQLANVLVGKTPLLESSLRFDLKPEHLQLTEVTARTADAIVHASGRAHWKGNKGLPKNAIIEAAGEAHSVLNPRPWEIPFDVSGDLSFESNGTQGRINVSAKRPLLQNRPAEPLEAAVRWGSRQVSWSGAHWGRHWSSQGTLDWSAAPAVWTAHVKADRAELEAWQPLLWPGGPKDLQGMLSGSLDLTGPSDNLRGGFALRLDDGRWKSFQFAADAQGRWDRASGIKPLTVSAHLKSGGDIQFSGSVTPDHFAQGTVKVAGFNLLPLGESLGFPKPLGGLAGATLTLRGPLPGLTWSGHIEGGPLAYGDDPEHSFKLEHVTMDMTLARLGNARGTARLTLTEAQAQTEEELIRFQSGSYIDFAGRQTPAHLKVGTEIRNLHLGLFTLFGGLDLDGEWQIKPEGFAIQTNARTHSLFINDYELEEGLVLADYYNGVLRFPAPPSGPALVTGSINFHAAPQLHFTDFFISGKNQEGLEFSGDIGPTLWDFRMVGRGLDMGILGELSGFPYPLSGQANVQIHGTGDPKHPHVDGKVDLERGTALGLAFRSGTAAFVWQDARLSLSRLSLSSPGNYTLEGAGVIPLVTKEMALNPDHSIDFSIRLIDSNLSLLQSLSSEIKQAKGPVEGLLQVRGTLEDPSLQGSLKIVNGSITGAHYFRELKNAALTVEFNGEDILIRDLRGRSGDGEFRSSGTITLAGFQPSRYDLALDVVSSKGVEVQVPELAIPESPLAKRFRFLTSASRGDVRGHVTLRGPAEAPVFSGTGIISNGHFTFPPSRKSPPSPAIMDWFRRITWDVVLKFQDGAWFDNELIQAGVAGDLRLKGPSDKLRVDGGLEIDEGKISYLGLQFDVTQAHYDVRSEVTGDTVVNTPYVRGLAESQIQAVDTVSGISGASGGSRLSVSDTITLVIDYAPVDQIKPRLTSSANPTLSQEKILARVTQTDIENLTPQERTGLYQKQIMSIIDNSLTTPIAQNILKKTGIADRVRVQHVYDPNTSAAQDLNQATAAQQQSTGVNLFANTKYTIEKDLSARLSLGYGVRFVPSAVTVDPELQQQQKLDLISDVQLSYRWFRNVYLKGDFELPSSNPTIVPDRKVTIEPRWRFGWWGNTNPEKEKPKNNP